MKFVDIWIASSSLRSLLRQLFTQLFSHSRLIGIAQVFRGHGVERSILGHRGQESK